MNILFVDDRPEIKIKYAIDFLKSKNLKFDYNVFKGVNSATCYICDNISKVDLAVIDLGLPILDDGFGYHEINGLQLIETILSITSDVLIIINSTTDIKSLKGITEEEYFKKFSPAIISHVEYLDGEWLYDFLNEHLKEKIEFC